MAEQCKNCGSELFAGQRFCRFCGQPSGQFDEENLPTQRMPQADTAESRGRTAPPASPGTNPIYVQPQGFYQPPMPGPPAPPYLRQRPRSPWGWIIALASIGLFSAMFFGVLFFARSHRPPRELRQPPPQQAVRSGEMVLGREGADVTSKETTFTETFQLGGNAKFSLNTMSGDVAIEGWDKPQAEVKVVKRGGSPEDRAAVEIKVSKEAGGLSIRTAPTRGDNIQVSYVVKLPHNLREVVIESMSAGLKVSDINGAITLKTQSGQIEFTDGNGRISVNSQSGRVKLSDVDGEITVNTMSGSIDLVDVTGAAKTNSMSGNTKVIFEDVTPGSPLEFKSVSGNVDLQFNSDINADLEARTVSGDIDLQDDFEVTKKEWPGSKSATGRIGMGGQPLTIKTVSGDIKVRK